jgi:hypothetical protein
MDGLTLLQEAQGAGLTVLTDGDRLVIRGPQVAAPVVRRLLANKLLVIRAMAVRTISPADMTPDDLSAEWRVEFEERAAILEYDGGLVREHAEAVALGEIVDRMRTAAKPI